MAGSPMDSAAHHRARDPADQDLAGAVVEAEVVADVVAAGDAEADEVDAVIKIRTRAVHITDSFQTSETAEETPSLLTRDRYSSRSRIRR